MHNAIIGLIIGSLAGIIIGATVIGPQFKTQITAARNIPAPATTQPLTNVPPKQIRVNHKPAQPAQRWRMASAYAGALPIIGEQAKRLETQIKVVSGGQLEIRFHEPGALVAPMAMFEAVRSGTIQAAFSTPALWADKIPALQLFSSIPFGPGPREYMAWFYGAGGQALFDKLYDKHGIYSLICGIITPEGSGWFKKPIKTVDDLKGLRMGITGLGARVMEKLGVIPETLMNGDVFIALQSGAIDAAEFSLPIIDLTIGLHQVANYTYFPGWHQPATFFDLMINKEAWTALPQTTKTQIQTVCGDNIRHSLTQADSRQFSTLKEFTKMDIHLEMWPKKILLAFRDAWRKVAREQSKSDPDFKVVWQSLQSFRGEYGIWYELSAP